MGGAATEQDPSTDEARALSAAPRLSTPRPVEIVHVVAQMEGHRVALEGARVGAAPRRLESRCAHDPVHVGDEHEVVGLRADQPQATVHALVALVDLTLAVGR